MAANTVLMPVLQYLNNIPVDVMRSKGVDTVSLYRGVLQTAWAVCSLPCLLQNVHQHELERLSLPM